jgi:hypothetical protein
VNRGLSRIPLIAALFQLVPSLASADCASDLAQAQAAAARIDIEIHSPEHPRVGDAVIVKWRKPHGDLSHTPIYLVVSAPSEIRFAGTDMIGLTAEARGPLGLAYAAHSARAIIPFQRLSAINQGQVSVLPYKVGAQTIGWAVLAVGACGERLVRSGEEKVVVATGAPELLVRDRFADENPRKHIRSLNGAFDLLVFKDRYAVYDVASGEKIVDLPGSDPNFSPSSRFVAAKKVLGSEGLEIYDLIARKKIAETGSGLLAWMRDDSYLIYGGPTFGHVTIWNAIVDRPSVFDQNLSCHACGAFDNVRLRFDLDRGYAFGVGQELEAVDLVTAETRPKDPDSNEFAGSLPPTSDNGSPVENQKSFTDQLKDLQEKDLATPADDTFDLSDPKKALQYIRREFDPALKQLPTAWEVGERLTLSHAPEFPVDRSATREIQHEQASPMKEAWRRSAPTVIQHTLVTAGQVSDANTGSQLVGKQRGLLDALLNVLRKSRTPTPANEAFDRLAGMGLVTSDVPELNRVYVRPEGLAEQCCDIDPTAKKISDELHQSYAAIQDQFLGKSTPVRMDDGKVVDSSTMACADIGEDGLDPDHIAQVLHWEQNGHDNWLIQAICAQGSGAFGYTDFILIRGGEKPTVRILNELFGADLFVGQFSEQFRAKIVRIRDDIFAVTSPIMDKLLLVDVAAEKRLRDPIDVPRDAKLTAVRFSADGRHLVQLNENGDISIYRTADGQRVLTGKFVEGEVVLATDTGLYDTTYEGTETVQVRFPGLPGLYRFDQFEKELRRNGLVKSLLAGEPVAPPPTTIAPPPTAQLMLATAPLNGHRVGKVVASGESPLVSVRLYIDGRLAQEIPVNGTRAETAIDVQDPGGGRWVSAVAVDGHGASSQPSAIRLPGSARPIGTMRAIVVGVDQYTDPDLPTLDLAKVDAGHFEQALQKKKAQLARNTDITLLLDRDATPRRVLDAVQAAARATTPEDLLLLYFAGHGLDGRGQISGGLALATTETRLTDLRSTALLWSDLADALALAAGKVVVFLDACHAGLSGNRALATNDDLTAALLTRTGAPMVVLAGSKGRQSTEENSAVGGGIFTTAMVAVIDDSQRKNGLIDLSDFYATVRAQVMEATDGRQTPWLARNLLVGEMALF